MKYSFVHPYSTKKIETNPTTYISIPCLPNTHKHKQNTFVWSCLDVFARAKLGFIMKGELTILSTTAGKMAHFMEAARMMRRGPTTTDTGWKMSITVRRGHGMEDWTKWFEIKMI